MKKLPRWALVLVILFGVIPAVVMLVSLVVALVRGEVNFKGSYEGHLESSGTTGKYVLEHGDCYSGERDGFFGVSVEKPGNDDIVVQFVKDPVKGWTVIANIADTCKAASKDCQAEWFAREDCSKLDVNLKLDPTRKTQFFDGSASIDCSGDGAHVFGDLTMKACRAPPRR